MVLVLDGSYLECLLHGSVSEGLVVQAVAEAVGSPPDSETVLGRVRLRANS